ncbi:Uncharacterized protein SCF082_LOCUS28045 [Durusdinium trenchii]|uniref:Uncharacterized protein n=1 Tax=Durusdinium trenchii TaxID=1381693 RepID=A0ABP0MJV6_9DINO
MDKCILSSSSITQRIEHSNTFSDVFAKFCSKQESSVDGSRIKNLKGQKNRFASFSKPLGRCCLFLDSVISTANWIAVQRRGGEEAHDALSFLDFLNEERCLMLSLMAEAADECVSLIRVFDTEAYDVASIHWEISAFVNRLNYLFCEEGVWEIGYVKEMLQYLRRQRAFIDSHGNPKTLGGPNVLIDRKSCLNRLQMFVNLVKFRDEYFDIRPMALHEFSKGSSGVDAWLTTVQRLETKQAAVRKVHPTSTIRQVLIRYAAWNGLTTSGVEQSFSKVQRHVTPQRDHMLLETEWDEAALQLNQTLCTDLQLTQKAGEAGNTEAAWKRRRKQSIDEAMEDVPESTLDEIQGNARMLSSHLLSDSILAEQSFQCDKQHKNRLIAYLDNCLLESEVDGEFKEVAQAFKDAQDKTDKLNAAARQRKADLLNPKKLPDPMSKKVFVVDPQTLDDMTEGLLRGCLVGDPEHADFIVETDPASPQDTSLWSAFMLGLCICNMSYVLSHGREGVAFSYATTVQSKRSIFISAEFHRKWTHLAEVVRFAVVSIDSKWKEIATLQEFAELSVTATEKKNLEPKKILSKLEMVHQCHAAFL